MINQLILVLILMIKKLLFQTLVANVVNEVLFGYHYKFNDCKRLMDYADNLAAQVSWSF